MKNFTRSNAVYGNKKNVEKYDKLIVVFQPFSTTASTDTFTKVYPLMSF